jgi:hypothetical protein
LDKIKFNSKWIIAGQINSHAGPNVNRSR